MTFCRSVRCNVSYRYRPAFGAAKTQDSRRFFINPSDREMAGYIGRLQKIHIMAKWGKIMGT